MTHKFLGARGAGRNVKRWQEELLVCQQRMVVDNNSTHFVQPKGCCSVGRRRREGRLFWLRSLCSVYCRFAQPGCCRHSPQSCCSPACPRHGARSPRCSAAGLTLSQTQTAPAPPASIKSILTLKAPVLQALSSWSLCSGKNNAPEQPGIYLICCP